MLYKKDTPKKTQQGRCVTGSLGLLGLGLTALILSLGRAMLTDHVITMEQESMRLTQELAMHAEELKLAASLFVLTPKTRRSFGLTATAYCPQCGVQDDTPQRTAIGGRPVRPGRTVAVSRDLRHLLGRKVYVEGLGLRVVEDLMHPRFLERVDLCLPDREQALAFGVKRVNIVVVD